MFWQVISRSIPNTPDGACGFERNQNGWWFACELSPTLFGYFIARKLALEQLHLGLGVLPHNMVRGSSAPSHKTIPQALDSSGFPDVSHGGFMAWKTANGLSRRDGAASA
jgi:hypothetical protein